jgi:hypothetical protein
MLALSPSLTCRCRIDCVSGLHIPGISETRDQEIRHPDSKASDEPLRALALFLTIQRRQKTRCLPYLCHNASRVARVGLKLLLVWDGLAPKYDQNRASDTQKRTPYFVIIPALHVLILIILGNPVSVYQTKHKSTGEIAEGSPSWIW